MSKQKQKSESTKITLEVFLEHVENGELMAGNIPFCHPKTGKKIYLPMWEAGKVKELVFAYRPCPMRDPEHQQTFVVENHEKGINVFKLKLHRDVYTELPSELWRPWRWVLYHDDSPCSGAEAVRLVNGYCPSCKIHPDTQSMCLKGHCPDCDVLLARFKDMREDHVCPECQFKFRTPTPTR